MVRRRKAEILDEDSPDFSTCEHCGERIGWDDYSYTHMTNGFATCGTKMMGGSRPRGFLKRLTEHLGIEARVDPQVIEDPAWAGRTAEPVEWFEEAA